MDKVVTSEVLVGGDFNGHAVNDMDMDMVFQIAVKGRIGGGGGGFPPVEDIRNFWEFFYWVVKT